MFKVNNKETRTTSFDKKLEQRHWLRSSFTQLVITCLKLTIKTLEQGVKYVQS